MFTVFCPLPPLTDRHSCPDQNTPGTKPKEVKNTQEDEFESTLHPHPMD